MTVIGQCPGRNGWQLIIEVFPAALPEGDVLLSVVGPRLGTHGTLAVSREDAAELGRALVRLFADGQE